jgi:FtsZ-interacting cell division protein ZipA
MELSAIITGAIAVLGTVFGAFWKKAKGTLGKVFKLSSETLQLIEKLESALEDDKITKKEIEEIKKEAQDVKLAWKALTEKKK